MAGAQSEALPIGSGMVNAVYETPMTERTEGSAMRWRKPGEQAILNVTWMGASRPLSGGVALLSATYQDAVSLPDEIKAADRRAA